MEKSLSSSLPQTQLPHAVDAERAVLGALLINNDLFVHTEGMLKENLFYDSRHQILYRVMVELYAKGHVDPIALTHRLLNSNELEKVDGREYIAEIADIGAAPINVPPYIELIRDRALLRLMITSLSESINEAFHPREATPQQVLDQAEGRLSAVGDTFNRAHATMSAVGDVARVYFDEMADIVRTQNYDSLLGVPSGFSQLDKMTSGFHAGDLVILAGRPGSGKTAFGLNIARHVSAVNAQGVLCFSLEMSAKQLTMRLLSHVGVDMQKLRVGRGIGAKELALLASASSELEERNIYVDDAGVLNILEARTRARRIKREMQNRNIKLGLIVVDYLQLMESESKARMDNRAFEVSAVSRGLKSLAKELQVPVLALSQLNRSIETRVHKRPMLSDLRESGAIEQDADVILFLHQDKEEGNSSYGNHSGPEKIELIIGKQRNGPVGSISLHFNKHFSRFSEISHQSHSFETEYDHSNSSPDYF